MINTAHLIVSDIQESAKYQLPSIKYKILGGKRLLSCRRLRTTYRRMQMQTNITHIKSEYSGAAQYASRDSNPQPSGP